MLMWVRLLMIALIVFAVVGIVAIIILAITGSGKRQVKGDGSYFDGGTLQLIGWRLLASLLTSITCGIAFPWAMCMLQRWEVKHTVINGRRLRFTGNGAQLFGKYILWAFLTVITCGIYSIWFGLGMKKWVVKHTVYEDDCSGLESRFTGGAGGWFVNHMLMGLALTFTCGIALPWAQVHHMKWEAEHSVINGSPLVFEGTGGQLFVKNLLLGILTPITLGIYAIFYPVKLLKWEYSNTQALYRTTPIQKIAHEPENAANVDFAKFGLAANEAELSVLKSGIKGDETIEQLEELAKAGNPYAMYKVAEATEDAQKAQEYIRLSASAKYHPALFKYAQNFANNDETSFVNYLEESARCGNTIAPWILKNFYENKAYAIKRNNLPEATKLLKNAVYWFKIAIEQNHPEAVSLKAQYKKMIENVALWVAGQSFSKSSGAGLIVAMVAGLLVLVLGVGAVCGIFLGITPRFFTAKESIRGNEYITYPVTAQGQTQTSFYFEQIIEDDDNTTSNAKVYDSEYPIVDEYIKENYSNVEYETGIYDVLKQHSICVSNNFHNAYVNYQICFDVCNADEYVKEILVYDTNEKKFTVVDDFTYEGVIKNNSLQNLYIIIIVKKIPESNFTSWWVEFDYKHLGFLSVEQGEKLENETEDNTVPSTENIPELTLEKAKELIDMENVGFLLYHFRSNGMIDNSKTYQLYTFNNTYETCYAATGINTIEDLENYLLKFYTKEYAKRYVTEKYGHWRIENNVIYFEPNYAMGENNIDRDTVVINEIGKGQYTLTAETEWSGLTTIYVSYEDGDYKLDLFIGPEFTTGEAWNLIYNLYEMEIRTLDYFEDKDMIDRSKSFKRIVPDDDGIDFTAYAIKGISNAEELRKYVYNFCTPEYHLSRHDNPAAEAPTTNSYMTMWYTEGGTLYISNQYDYPWFIKEETCALTRTQDGYYVTVNQFASGDPNGKPEMELRYTIVYEDGKYLVDSWGSAMLN